jgi:hypothetical protein
VKANVYLKIKRIDLGSGGRWERERERGNHQANERKAGFEQNNSAIEYMSARHMLCIFLLIPEKPVT